MFSSLSSKKTAKNSDNQTSKKKTVMFNDQSNNSDQIIQEDSDFQLDDTEVQSIAKNNSLILQGKCLNKFCNLDSQQGLKSLSPQTSKMFNIQYSQLPLSSGLKHNTIISIHLSPLNSDLSHYKQQAQTLKMKRKMEDEDILIFSQFSQKHGFKLQSSSNKSFTFKKTHSRAFQLFNCLMFKNAPEINIRLQILSIANLIKIDLISGNQEEYLFYQKALKKTMWSHNLVKLDEIQSINYLLNSEINAMRLLMKQIHSVEKHSLTFATLESIMISIVNQRKELLKKAYSKDTYEIIDIEGYIDSKLFSQIKLSSLYEKFYSQVEGIYQGIRQKISNQWSSEQQFQFLQVPIQYRLGSLITPYKSAIQELTKMNFDVSPLEKLKTVKEVYKLIKQTAYTQSGKHIQPIQTISILIYVVLNSKVSHIHANVCMLDHFLQSINHTEQKIVSSLYMSLQYISTSWKK